MLFFLLPGLIFPQTRCAIFKGKIGLFSVAEDGGKDDSESTLSSDLLLTGRRGRLKLTEGPDGMRMLVEVGEKHDFPSDGFWFPHICSKGFCVIGSSGDLKEDLRLAV